RGRDRRMQGAKEPQRVAIAVERAPGPARNVADRPDLRLHAGTVEDLDIVPLEAWLRQERVDARGARVELVLREARVQAARLAQRNVDAGGVRDVGGERRPFARRALRPRA